MRPAEERLDEVEEQVAFLAELLRGQPDGPWTWRTLRGENRSSLWAQLHDFVGWLQERYLRSLGSETYPLPPTWFESPVAVELLTALMVSHRAAYSMAQVEPSFALVEWHERCLFPTLERLRDVKIFHNNAVRTPSRSVGTDDDAFATFLTEDLRMHQAPARVDDGVDDGSGSESAVEQQDDEQS